MPYADLAAIVNDPDLRFRVGAALVKTALDVVDEAGVANLKRRQKRAGLAAAVLANPSAIVDRIMLPLAVRGMTPAITDAQLDNVLANAWDKLALVSAEEKP